MRNGPIIDMFGTWWYSNDKLHRDGAPAIEHVDGSSTWFINGERHRLDGPAVDWKHKEWWINGRMLWCKTQEEFEHLMKLKAFW